jgi:3-methylfumaryl-CoA hydratase
VTALEGSDWSPTEDVVRDVVTTARAVALHGLLDAPGDPPRDGAPLPMLWHWLAFLPAVPQAQLGPDGHPHLGGFLPPVQLPRRMFGAGEVTQQADRDQPAEGGDGETSYAGELRVGEPLERRGAVTDVRSRTGRSGELVIVTVGYEVTCPGGSLVERQELVYREAASRPPNGTAIPGHGAGSAAGPTPAGPDHASWEWGIDLEVQPTLLFRFSALTYNAHRIHYDRAWATEVEGYPGLVVHGPLQAVGLAELCRRFVHDRRLCRFQFRAVSPTFDDGPLLLRGRPGEDDGAVVLEAFDQHGATTMTATGTLA